MTLGRNLLLMSLMLVLVFLAIYQAMDLNRSGREQVINQFNTTQLLLAQEAAHEATLLFQEYTTHLATLGRLSSVQRGDGPRILEDLELYSLRPEAARHASLMVLNTNGDVAFSSNGPVALNLKRCEFFEWSRLKKNRGAVFVSSWARAVGTTNAAPHGAILLASPLYQTAWDSETRRSLPEWSGVLLLTVDLDRFLREHLAPVLPISDQVRFWIMDRDGTVLLQSEHPEMATANIYQTQLECAQCHVSFDYARRMFGGGAGVTEYQLKDQPKKLAAYVPVRFANASWIMVVNAPYDVVTAYVGQSYRKTMLLLLTVGGVLSLASVMVYRTNVSRVRAKEEAQHWHQKHQLEEQLRRAEERYRTLFEQSPDGILMLEPETLLPMEFNDAAHAQLGYSREEFSRMSEAEHAAHGTLADMKALFDAVPSGGSKRVEIELRTRDRKLRTVEIIVQPLRLANRIILHCIHHDITERKQAEETLTGRTAQLEALHQVSLSITAEMETSTLLHSITHKALTLFHGHSAGLWLHRRSTEELERVVAAGNETVATGVCLKRGESLAGRCWEKAAPLAESEKATEGSGTPGEPTRARSSAMAAPLRWGDTFLGVLEIRSATAGFFTREDAALLGLFANQAAIAIKNAGLLERVRRDEDIKTTLLHDVSHRVKNNLARLLEIIRLERERSAPEATGCHAALADLEQRLRSMELVHTMLSSSQWHPLPLRELVTQVVSSALSGSPIRERIRVSVVAPSDSLQVVPEQATALALILSELATNSVKHAFSSRTEGRMEVCLQVDSEVKGRPSVRLKFQDDGPGWPDEVLHGQSRHVGLRLIRASVRSPLRGELALRNENGAVAEVSFRLALIE